ncbi:thioesterase family protein [Dysgonomonas sp. 520]|uniref:acyl-CoA thioesterase n=1 Tax=Dysgonomonas sp. 520 TaxID=2302931 RepID=UPI0013D125B9|nr:acyl-CoA thioesterase [Dysgonomonas sp. 520]NDW08405.1 acyl-CoA thioesterase [Dysgonomonas sp. 520]
MEEDEIVYNHSLPLQIRFNDMDQFGHVNNSVYLNFYDTAKTDYIRTVCPNVNWKADAIVVVHIEVTFKAQIYSTDNIAVQTAVTGIGTKSFDLTQRIIDMDTNEEKCVGRSTMVAYDLIERQTNPLKDEWVKAICEFEGKDLRRKKN